MFLRRASFWVALAVFVIGAGCGALGHRLWREVRHNDDVWSALKALHSPVPPPSYIHRQDTIALSLMQPTIIMLGDSLTQEGSWVELTGCASVANFGVGADTTQQILKRLPAVIAAKPRAVLLMAGANDISQGIAIDSAAANVARIMEQLEQAGIHAFLQTAPPMAGHVGAAAELSRRAQASSPATITIPFNLADLRSDGVHLSASGYDKWRTAIAPVIAKYCSQPIASP